MDDNPEVEVIIDSGRYKLIDIPRVEYLDEKSEKYNSFKAFIRNGTFVRNNGQTVDTTHAKSKDKIYVPDDGYFIFVINKHKEIFIHEYVCEKYHHTSTTNGQPVFSAGMIKIASGELKGLSFASGHYQCGTIQVKNTLRLFDSLDVKWRLAEITIPKKSEIEVAEILSSIY